MQVLFPAVFTVRSGGGGKKINLSRWQPHEPKEMYGQSIMQEQQVDFRLYLR